MKKGGAQIRYIEEKLITSVTITQALALCSLHKLLRRLLRLATAAHTKSEYREHDVRQAEDVYCSVPMSHRGYTTENNSTYSPPTIAHANIPFPFNQMTRAMCCHFFFFLHSTWKI